MHREANTDAEREAAERRARVAAAVNKQEWLDKTEVKFGVRALTSPPSPTTRPFHKTPQNPPPP